MGSVAIIAELFPGLWDFTLQLHRSFDQFFGATGGYGYSYPWSESNMSIFRQRSTIERFLHAAWKRIIG